MLTWLKINDKSNSPNNLNLLLGIYEILPVEKNRYAILSKMQILQGT